MITNEQLAGFAGLILAGASLLSVVLVFVANRTTASPQAINALSATIGTLRSELEAEKKARALDREQYKADLLAETGKRKDLELRFEQEQKTMVERFEKERKKYQSYIGSLRTAMIRYGIKAEDIPEWNTADE